MVSQLVFGENYMVIEEHDKWMRVQSERDQYRGFMDKKMFYLTHSNIEASEKDNFILSKGLVEVEVPDQGVVIIGPGSRVPKAFQTDHINHLRDLNNFDASIEKMIADAYYFNGAPYLWGGKNILGVDCSGLMQILMHMIGKTYPRDAYQQEAEGDKIDFNDHLSGDFAFFKNETNNIVHVGLITDKNKIIHASGWVREDKLTAQGILDQKGIKTHDLFSIKRMAI
jgi:cell wall-associated NlpC family hydrolase